MSTRCFIGYRTENLKIVGIYCGHDGYPTHVGRILLEHYNNLNKLKELVVRGNLSSIEETPDKCDWYKDGSSFRIYDSLSDIVKKSAYEYIYVYEKRGWYIGEVEFLIMFPIELYEKNIVSYKELTEEIVKEDV